MSKAIYTPKGKAGEYAEWACNLYVGCSNDCSYCYCKRGVLAHAMGGPAPKLKSCFKDENHALDIFIKELEANLPELQKSSLFFTFSSDPMIPETRKLNWDCIVQAVINDVPVQVLTKNADFIKDEYIGLGHVMAGAKIHEKIAWGFTLTGRDDLEPGASRTEERIEAMEMLHRAGYRTFASLEPVVTPKVTASIAEKIAPYCDLIKVGLMSGVPHEYYKYNEVMDLAMRLNDAPVAVQFKHSISDYLGWDRMNPISVFKCRAL